MSDQNMLERRVTERIWGRILLGGGALVVWFVLVLLEKTSIEPFVEVLKVIVNTVIVYHLTLTTPLKK